MEQCLILALALLSNPIDVTRPPTINSSIVHVATAGRWRD